jgi:regulator of replication initiation timing
MLFQLRKENIELNDEYNKMIDKKTRLKIEYLKMKKRLDDFQKEEESEKHEHEQFESLDVFIESVRNTLNSIVISSSITSKKLLDSSIFIDKKIRISKIDY